MPSNSNAYCQVCDLVSRHGAVCPTCGGGLRAMGPKWRPGRKGSRTRMWDTRPVRRKEQKRFRRMRRWWGYRHPMQYQDRPNF